jgi:hypothetical protein
MAAPGPAIKVRGGLSAWLAGLGASDLGCGNSMSFWDFLVGRG